MGLLRRANAADHAACFGFGGEDPRAAFEALVAQANGAPIPAPGTHPEAIRGDEILLAALGALYEKRDWQDFAAALVEAQPGNATRLRALVDEELGLLEDGTYDPMGDRGFSIVAAEQSYGPDIETYEAAGELAWSSFPHFWWNNGYSELGYGLFPIEARGVFRGPFVASRLPRQSASVGRGQRLVSTTRRVGDGVRLAAAEDRYGKGPVVARFCATRRRPQRCREEKRAVRRGPPPRARPRQYRLTSKAKDCLPAPEWPARACVP